MRRPWGVLDWSRGVPSGLPCFAASSRIGRLMPFLWFLLMFMPLVIFHEFGHFAVARWMGVHVLSFSIGFGPVVFRTVRNGTEYALRLLPLGGFVRMLGDDPVPDMEGESASDPRALHNKAVWQRALIVAAGPIFNFILPVFILFFGSLAVDAQIVSARLGTVLPGGPAAEAGLLAGDRILAIAGEPIAGFDDLKREVSARPGQPVQVAYERENADGSWQRRTAVVQTKASRQVRVAELGLVETVGRIEIRPDAEVATVSVEPDSPAWRAGLRPGDRITKVGERRVERLYELEPALAAALRSGQAVLEVARLASRKSVPRTELQAFFDAQHGLRDGKPAAPLAITLTAPAGTSMSALGLRGGQRLVGPVEAGSPADWTAATATAAGQGALLRPGDELLQLDGKPVRSLALAVDALADGWDEVRTTHRTAAPEELLKALQDALGRPRTLLVRHVLDDAERAALQGAAATPPADPLLAELARRPDLTQVLTQGYADRTATLRLQVSLGKDERPKLAFGAMSLQDYAAPELTANPSRVAYAAQQMVSRLSWAVQVTGLTVFELFRGNVPMREVGGPLLMAQMATKAAEIGMGPFFELMVWLSVNLGILNLLPVPILDGGHLVFLGLEAVQRRAPSLRTRQIAAYIGLALLGLLMLVVFRNDLTRLLTPGEP